MKFILSISLLFLLSNENLSEWKLEKQKDNITIYTRKTKFNLKEFRAVTSYNSTLDKVKNELSDVKNMNLWYDMITKVEVLKQISKTEAIYKIYFDFPAITSDRYSIIQGNLTHDDNTVKVKTKYVDFPHTKETDRVLITNIYSEWSVTKNGNKLDVEHIGFMDPAGSIPQWMVNTNVVDSPMKTIKNLKRRVE